MKKNEILKKFIEVGVILTLACGGVANAKSLAPTPKNIEALDILQIASHNKNIKNVREVLETIGQIGYNESGFITKEQLFMLNQNLKQVRSKELISDEKSVVENAVNYLYSADRIDKKGTVKIFNTLVEIGMMGKNYNRPPNRFETAKIKNILIKSGIIENSR